MQEMIGDDASPEGRAAFTEAFKSELQAREAGVGRQVGVTDLEDHSVEITFLKTPPTPPPEESTLDALDDVFGGDNALFGASEEQHVEAWADQEPSRLAETWQNF